MILVCAFHHVGHADHGCGDGWWYVMLTCIHSTRPHSRLSSEWQLLFPDTHSSNSFTTEIHSLDTLLTIEWNSWVFCMGANSYSFLLLIYHIFNLKTLLFWSCLICSSLWLFCLYVNLSPSGQNGHHFADDIFKWIFFNGTVWISIQISLKYAPKGPINNESALV